jgi:hypothetical protein
MKKLSSFKSGVVLMLSFLTACSGPAYLGKTYTPTQNVDIYLDAADVKKPYEIMGTSEVGQGLSSLNAVQEKVINLGKGKGADGVIMKLTEEVTGSQKNDYGSIQNGKKNNTYTGGSVTNNIKVKKVQATFIKYQ